jgi:hypothetical protein
MNIIDSVAAAKMKIQCSFVEDRGLTGISVAFILRLV